MSAQQLHGCKFVRLLWCDAAGIRRLRSIPLHRLEEVQRDGLALAFVCMFLPGWGDCPPLDPAASPVGEMLLIPDMETLHPLPWNTRHAMVLVDMCAAPPSTPWQCCPRAALRGMLRLLEAETGLGVQVGFECEFTLLHTPGAARTLEPVDTSVYCQSSAYDASCSVLDDMCESLEALGLAVEQTHAESAHGQYEIAMRYNAAAVAADNLILSKETICAVARRHGLIASFLPKVFEGQAGNGCHCHSSFSGNAMADAHRPHGLSIYGEWFIAGILEHLPALMAFTTPTTNSYRRILPSTWSGAYRCWGVNNREAPLRLVGRAEAPGTLNVELKAFDATANPCIALVAMVAAGLLGIRGKLGLRAPAEVDPATLSEGERTSRGFSRLPTTLEEALAAAAADTQLVAVMNSAVGGEDLVRAYLAVKRSECHHFKDTSLEAEVAALHARY